MKHIICFSGGHSSGLVAIEVFRKYGKESMILLNHDINPQVEHEDIKRFKKEVADYIGLPITYANCLGIKNPNDIPNQFQVCRIAKAFKVGDGTPLCTNRLKTAPFYNWLAQNIPTGEAIIYYGFDKKELDRIIRRRKILLVLGYETCFPLAEWEQTIFSTTEININPPCTYTRFKHANCIGCLRAGRQHWYIVYCLYPDIWKEAIQAEEEIGYTIISGISLKELEPLFEKMKTAGIEPTEKIPHQKFWVDAKKIIKVSISDGEINIPCECFT
jgi:hypothetical protein